MLRRCVVIGVFFSCLVSGVLVCVFVYVHCRNQHMQVISVSFLSFWKKSKPSSNLVLTSPIVSSFSFFSYCLFWYDSLIKKKNQYQSGNQKMKIWLLFFLSLVFFGVFCFVFCLWFFVSVFCLCFWFLCFCVLGFCFCVVFFVYCFLVGVFYSLFFVDVFSVFLLQVFLGFFGFTYYTYILSFLDNFTYKYTYFFVFLCCYVYYLFIYFSSLPFSTQKCANEVSHLHKHYLAWITHKNCVLLRKVANI